jgi:hypothetical protein
MEKYFSRFEFPRIIEKMQRPRRCEMKEFIGRRNEGRFLAMSIG